MLSNYLEKYPYNSYYKDMPIDILCLGGTSIDIIESTPSRGPDRVNVSVGGSVTNTAVICAKLGLNVAMLSRIGKDQLGNFAVKFLKSQRVDTQGIIQDPRIQTPRAIASLDKSGNAKYTFYKNHPKDSVVLLKSTPKTLLKNVKILHFGSSYSHQLETYQESLKYIKFLKAQGAFISLDPNLRPYTIKDKLAAKKRVFNLLRLVDMAKLSIDDLIFLAGTKDPVKGLKICQKKWLNTHFILTLGSKGSVHLSGVQTGTPDRCTLVNVPAFKVNVADTIGAGDAFTGGLLYKLIKEGKEAFFANIEQHMVFASAVSALTCTQKGANKGLKGIKQVNSFIARHPKY